MNYKTITLKEFEVRYDVNFKVSKEELLGVGGFGRVYLGYDKILNQKVGIKRAETDKGLLSEVEMGKDIPSHPNIARYLDGFRIDAGSIDYDVAIMQYYPAGNLDQLLFPKSGKSKVSATQINQILEGILKGLDFLHKGFKNKKGDTQYYIHRDLKPANILIAENQGRYIPLITDFGMSKSITKSKEAEQHSIDISTTGGTFYYKAPEQFTIGSKYNASLDLWAFGVMLYKLLSGGQLPFYSPGVNESESSRREVENQILGKDINLLLAQLAGQNPKHLQILQMCLVRDYKKRVQSAQELIDSLNDLSEEIEVAKKIAADEGRESGLKFIENLLKEYPNSAKLLQLKGDFTDQEKLTIEMSTALLLFESEDWEAAKKAFEEIITQHPNLSEAKDKLVICESKLEVSHTFEDPDEPTDNMIPEILNFSADFLEIEQGEKVSFKWQISGKAERVYLCSETTNIRIELKKTDGEIAIEPKQSDQYFLQVHYLVRREGHQKISQKINVEVVGEEDWEQEAKLPKKHFWLAIILSSLGVGLSLLIWSKIDTLLKMERSLASSFFSNTIQFAIAFVFLFGLFIYLKKRGYTIQKKRQYFGIVLVKILLELIFFFIFKIKESRELFSGSDNIYIIIIGAFILLFYWVYLTIPLLLFFRKTGYTKSVGLILFTLSSLGMVGIAGAINFKTWQDGHKKEEARKKYDEGIKYLESDASRDWVNETYFREAVKLDETLADSVRLVFENKAAKMREDPVFHEKYLKLAKEYDLSVSIDTTAIE